MPNTYRLLAQEYSELALLQNRMRTFCLVEALNKKLPFLVRKNSIRQAKYHQREVIAYAEQVERRAKDALIKEAKESAYPCYILKEIGERCNKCEGFC